MNLKGKTALITGAGQGMGLGVAKRLASEGALVLINDYYPERAESAAEQIRASGGDAKAAAFDVTDYSQVCQAVAALEKDTGGIDILINNAGNANAGGDVNQLAFKDLPQAEWENYLSVNLYGVMNCTKAVLNGMCERKWGRIITISSEAGRQGLDINVSVYGVAKAGAAHLMRHLAREVGPSGVTANVVSLGLMNNVPEEFTARIVKTIPARRLGEPEDVADSVSYLVGAGWVTGQTMVLNGGSYTG